MVSPVPLIRTDDLRHYKKCRLRADDEFHWLIHKARRARARRHDQPMQQNRQSQPVKRGLCFLKCLDFPQAAACESAHPFSSSAAATRASRGPWIPRPPRTLPSSRKFERRLKRRVG